MKKRIVIVTGASSGMGKQFALQLDKQVTCDEFWLIARNEERLKETQNEMTHPAKIVSLDLQDMQSIYAYRAMLEEENPVVHILVNGSGYGKFDKFEDCTLEDNLGMIDLNCRALTALTQITLPYIEEGGYILNVGSMSSFQPIPYINVYASTKAFVLSFSRALNRELKPKKISVTAFCPYWVNTAFFEVANRHNVITNFDVVYESDWVVAKGIKAMFRRKDVCIPGKVAKGTQILTKILPHSLVMSVWLKQQNLK